jgi:hypothetical protein
MTGKYIRLDGVLGVLVLFCPRDLTLGADCTQKGGPL